MDFGTKGYLVFTYLADEVDPNNNLINGNDFFLNTLAIFTTRLTKIQWAYILKVIATIFKGSFLTKNFLPWF